jgi:hypothetical protein
MKCEPFDPFAVGNVPGTAEDVPMDPRRFFLESDYVH